MATSPQVLLTILWVFRLQGPLPPSVLVKVRRTLELLANRQQNSRARLKLVLRPAQLPMGLLLSLQGCAS